MPRRKMSDAQIDALMDRAFAAMKAGAKVYIEPAPCPKCGATEPYRHSGTPNWMNRFTCPKCGRHESR